MAKKQNGSDTELALVGGEQVPAYLATMDGEGAQDIAPSSEYSRVKVIQAMSDGDLKDSFGEGSAILRPDDILLCDKKGSFNAVILFPFLAWSCWPDLKDKGGKVETVYDAEHPIAVKARNYNARTEPYAGGTMRFVEELNFAVLITSSSDGGDSEAGVAVVTFSRGGHKQGRKLRDRLRRFGQSKVPVFAHKIKFSVSVEKNKSGQAWHQLVWEPDGFVAEADIARFRGMYAEIKAAYESGKVKVAADASPAIETDHSEFDAPDDEDQ